MDAGLTISKDIIDGFTAINIKKSHGYMICSFSKDYKSVILMSTGPPGATFDEFKEAMKEYKDCACFVIVDVSYTPKERASQSKIAYIVWSPDNGAAKGKLLSASTAMKVKKKTAVDNMITINDWDDLIKETIVEHFEKHK